MRIASSLPLAGSLQGRHVAIIGAGIGGLSAGMLLAASGARVSLFDAAERPGGKIREIQLEGQGLDAGPTVFTLLPIFEALFAETGGDFHREIGAKPLTRLARHVWPTGETLDLFTDVARSAAAIAAFAGAKEAEGYRRFARDCAEIHNTLDLPFMRAQKPGMVGLLSAAGLGPMLQARPFSSYWAFLGDYFADPRLRQLFGRYATYCGASPFLAPATLAVIPHVERLGVFTLAGGMIRLAEAMAARITALGGRLQCGTRVTEIHVEAGRATGITLADGTRIAADAVISNVDANALASGLLGARARPAAPAIGVAQRSLSAVTLHALARLEGQAIPHHSVFFSSDYAREFAQIAAGSLPSDPTLYLCAFDRRDDGDSAPVASEERREERVMVLMNAPANGEAGTLDPEEETRCLAQMLQSLARSGLTLRIRPGAWRITRPAEFERRFPATGGSLYGMALHGATSAFRRPGARSALAGLYLCGGSVHPGAGVPMVAISGRLAAEALIADLSSTQPSRPMAMPGGIWTR